MSGGRDTDPLVGSMVGPCRIRARLASGGMGVVYRGLHGRTGRDVAVKVLAPMLASDPACITRFLREAKAASHIKHPNVVPVLQAGKQDDLHYLVMDYIEGETLNRLVQDKGAIPQKKALRIARDIASGLEAAHRAGIIHRDVKPSNVIISSDGKPHLTDFGLARDSQGTPGLTLEGTFLGTPEYASPEQVEARPLDVRSDLYSLGITLFAMLTAALPFQGVSPMEIGVKRTREDPQPLEEALPGADPGVCAVVKTMLQRDPALRYPSARAVVKDLDRVLAGRQPLLLAGASAETGTRLRAAVSWGLLAAGIVLAFCSGALSGRPERVEADPGRNLRIMLGLALGAGLVFTIFLIMHRRALRGWGRVGYVSLVFLMLLGSFGAGSNLDHSAGPGEIETLVNALRALAVHAWDPVNLLASTIFYLFVALLLSFELQEGSGRVLSCRMALLTAFALSFALGATGNGLGTSLKYFTAHPERSIPLAIISVIVCALAAFFVSSSRSANWGRVIGMLLAVSGASNIYAFAVIVSQPERSEWLELLWEPFVDLGGAFGRSGTALVIAVAAGAVVRSLIVNRTGQESAR